MNPELLFCSFSKEMVDLTGRSDDSEERGGDPGG
jgi:hypothetical protein